MDTLTWLTVGFWSLVVSWWAIDVWLRFGYNQTFSLTRSSGDYVALVEAVRVFTLTVGSLFAAAILTHLMQSEVKSWPIGLRGSLLAGAVLMLIWFGRQAQLELRRFRQNHRIQGQQN